MCPGHGFTPCRGSPWETRPGNSRPHAHTNVTTHGFCSKQHLEVDEWIPLVLDACDLFETGLGVEALGSGAGAIGAGAGMAGIEGIEPDRCCGGFGWELAGESRDLSDQ